MVSRYTGSGRHRESGFAAVHRQDFHAHTTGGDWRHTADQTDMNPAISTFNNLFNAPTVQETLERMASLIDTVGQGFITIGDGYNLGDYNVDSGTTLQQAFYDAFANSRLQNGGIVLVKSGTYRLTATVEVPAGITIMGEPAGTYIFGSMNEQPMFRCADSIKQFEYGTLLSTSLVVDDTTDRITFWNLILGDNLDGYKQNGSNIPIATMSTVPMIQLVHGANVVIDRVTMIGRITNDFPPLTQTLRAVGMDNTTTAASRPTSLTVQNCYIDAMQHGIMYDVRNGRIDTLRVQNNRIRNYGGATTELSSAVSFNLCNANLSGNYHIVGGFGAQCGFYLRNDAVADSSEVTINIINNSGGSADASLASADINSLFINASSYTARGLITGNSWGANNTSPWFLTVGDGTNSIGDITGTTALDIASEISAFSSALTSHIDVFVVVGYGTYTMTSGGTSGKMNLLGKPRHNVLPIIQLNSSTGTDEASNPTTTFGNHIENIHFKTTGASYNTARLNSGYGVSAANKKFNIVNCEFEDAGLIAQAPGRVDTFENITYTVEACHFYQTNAFANNFCFLLPQTADHVYLRDVSAITYGYVGGIGDVSGVYTSSAPVESTITLQNCIFRPRYLINSPGTNSITAASPLTGMNNFFFVNSTRARLLIENCNISCADDASGVSTTSIIGGGLPAAGSFKRYVSLQAKDIVIQNSRVFGPDQTYTVAAVNYCMAAVWAEPRRTIVVDNSKLRGSCALQISGTNQFNSIEQSAAIALSNSEFMGSSSTSSVTLDIDAVKFTTSGTGSFPIVSIDSCQIVNKQTASNYLTEHVNATTTYFALGIAQIYAEGWQVKITNTTIKAASFTNFPGSITSLVGLYIDTIGTGTGTLTDADVLLTNNSVKLTNDVGSGGNFVYACYLIGRNFAISNNMISVTSAVAAPTSRRSYMALAPTGSSSVVTGNTFKRGTSDLGQAAVYIFDGFGIFVDNVFDSATLDGTDTTLINDLSSAVWTAERNINQTSVLYIRPDTSNQGHLGHGHFAMSDGGNSRLLGDFGVVTGSAIDINATTEKVQFNYGTTTTEVDFFWYLAFQDILPSQASVISVRVEASASSTFSTSGDFFVNLRSSPTNLTGPGTADFTAVTTANITLTPGTPTDYKTGNSIVGGRDPTLEIGLLANGTVARIVTIDAIEVTYRW